MPDPVVLAVTESSQVGEARRAAVELVTRLGFHEPERGKVALVVAEAANNLVKHARQGEILLRALDEGGVPGVEVLAIDRGPGMPDVSKCLRDGFSTTASPGTGLGAIVRLSAYSDIFSLPSGTALLAVLWAGKAPRPTAGQLHAAAVSAPNRGETVCGDAWAVEQVPGRAAVLVADGLGHGPLAAAAAQAAVRSFRGNFRLGPVEILQAAHLALRGTRGAAAAVAVLDLTDRTVRYAGVGNIAGSVLSAGTSRSMVSHAGIVGHEARKIQEFAYPFPSGATLVMNSDGLASRWNLDPYPGLGARDPALVAGVLYRDFARGRDDATVLVARVQGEAAA